MTFIIWVQLVFGTLCALLSGWLAFNAAAVRREGRRLITNEKLAGRGDDVHKLEFSREFIREHPMVHSRNVVMTVSGLRRKFWVFLSMAVIMTYMAIFALVNLIG